MSNASAIKETVYYKAETAQIFAPIIALAQNAANDLPAAVAEKQKLAHNLFMQYGVPYPKLERWKYSNFYPILKKMDLAPAALTDIWHGDLSFVKPIKDMVSEQWLQDLLCATAPQSDEIKDDNAFWYLNDLHNVQGWVIDIPANTSVDQSLLLKTMNKDNTYNAERILIRVGRNARLVMDEQHQHEKNDHAYFKNWVTQIVLEDNAELVHTRNQNDSLKAAYVQNTAVTLGRDARYYGLTINKGAHMFRNQYHIVFEGEGAHASVRSSADVGADQHIDLTTCMYHNVKSCTSDQIVRNVLHDKATGVFQGKVYVAKGADYTDGSQSSKALLLSPLASMHAKPELEIYADEVKCAHGATCGAMDEKSLFYARSRGIPYEDARAMLVAAFLEEVKDGLPLTTGE
ncbi:MAG: Fe-S cluster assembly protein SufD [Pseudomonadota bacterium]|nr:Fe-S cluster assembly protein SufD [Pseudomonadota bacterium]